MSLSVTTIGLVSILWQFLESQLKKLFAVAHIDLITFSIPWFQVCYAFVLGIAYGYTFIRTKSVIYPMIMHSMSNVISVGGCYLYMLFFL